MTKFLIALGFIAMNFYTYYYLASDAVIPPRATFSQFPLEFDAWSCPEREEIEADVRANLGVTDYLVCTFTRAEPVDYVAVYVGYHASQVREQGGGAGENSIHPPAHCLPGSGWDLIDSRNVQLDVPGLPVHSPEVKRLVIAKGDARQLVYYWYQSRGRVIADDWRKIVYVGLDRALRGRTDGALVRFTIPIFRGDEARADAAFRDLAPSFLGELPAYVPI